MAYGNLISDISDHFLEFCILKSMKNKIVVNKAKMRDYSRFSSDRLNADPSKVNWNALFSNESSDMNSIFSSFYNKFNKMVNKHAMMKTINFENVWRRLSSHLDLYCGTFYLTILDK